ncbi:MAG: Fic family protein [Saprospiraceae bacterium]
MKNLLLAKELKKELDKLRPLSTEAEQAIMYKFRLDWNYHSNNIEGNSLSYGETKALLLHGITAQGKPLKDHFEITGHDEAIKWIMDILKQERPLTEKFIRELHRLILKTPYEVDAITPEGLPTKRKIAIGAYKTTPNHVKTATGEIFKFATPEETPAKMKELIDWFRAETASNEFDPIATAILFHYKFIGIHPFDDGNGRTVRILMNFILMSNGYPPAIIKTEEKENYYAALRQADAGIMEPFIDFVGDSLVKSLQLMIKGAKGIQIEEEEDLDKELAILEQKLKEKGPKIELTYSVEVLKELYIKSIINIVEAFIDLNLKFSRFYLKTTFRSFFNDDENSISRFKKEIFCTTFFLKTKRLDSRKMSFNIEFNDFQTIKFTDFTFSSKIEFHFQDSYYTISSPDLAFNVDKLYNEYMDDTETKDLMKKMAQQHRKVIEKFIADQKNT